MKQPLMHNGILLDDLTELQMTAAFKELLHKLPSEKLAIASAELRRIVEAEERAKDGRDEA